VFGQNHLFVKMLFNRDSTIQKCFRCFCTAFKTEDFKVPVSCLDEVSSHPDAHLSTIPSVRTTCHTIRTPDRPSIICPDDVLSHPDLHYFKKLLFQLESVRTFQQPVRTPLSDRSTSDSFQVQFKGRLLQPSRQHGFSHPDALLYKARIAIQISPSRRQSALVWMCVHQIRKLSIRLQPSGRLPIMVRTHA
jgi:hypothetical protein